MTEAERAHLMEQWFRDHDAEWTAYLAKPVAERIADQDKVEAAYRHHGVQAARDMSRALGRPSPPDEICDPVEVLEAKRVAGTSDGADQVRAMADMLDVTEEEATDILAERPAGRVDH